VPWCPSCDRFLSPPTVTPEGRCPQCGRPVEAGAARPPGATTETEAPPPPAEEDAPPVPLHMKILGASVVFYLGWRLIQGIDWVINRF
jgi:hypothetical protein